MTSAVFTPPKEQLGSLINTSYGPDYNNAKLSGLDKSYTAVYTRGMALVEAVTPVYDKAYYWKSASFFTGINLDLAEYINPVKDITTAVLAGLELIQNVLTILDSLVSLGINVLKVIVSKVLDLLASVITLFDIRGSFHMLIIPPKVGKLGGLSKTDITKKDSKITASAKKSERTRQDFIRYLNNLSNKLPEALGADVSKLVADQNNTLTGSDYLLHTIEEKLNDTTDLARPNLQPYSSCAGVGLFLGTSALNQFIKAWGSLNSLFGKSIDVAKYNLKGVPIGPVIHSERLNETNKLAKDRALQQGDFSPTEFSFVVRPVAPRFYTSFPGVAYEFKRRFILLNKDVPSIPEYSLAEFVQDVQSSLGGSDNLEYILEYPHDALSDCRSYLTMVFDGNKYITKRTATSTGFHEKIPTGNYYSVAVDIYKIPSTDAAGSDKYIYLSSAVKELTIKDTVTKKYAGDLLSIRGFDSFTLDTTSRYPMWIASEGSLAFLPQVFTTLVEFINFLKATITSLLDDALSFIKILLANLATIIDIYKAMVKKVDELIKLIKLIMSVTGDLGVSVMSFYGTGDATALNSMFREYLDPNTSSTTNIGPPLERDIKYSKILEEPDRINKASEQFEFNPLPELLVRESTSYLDPTGSIAVVNANREIVRYAELQKNRGDREADIPSITAAWNSSYNMSPLFTKEMTCGGIILLAHSHIQKDLVKFKDLLDLLFGSEENAPDINYEEELRSKGLIVDIPNLNPVVTSAEVVTPAAIFTADMKLTDNPSDSPFNFCPSD